MSFQLQSSQGQSCMIRYVECLCSAFYFVGYLTTLSLSRLYASDIDDRMINE
jgi:hypothetical protein